MNAKIFVSEQSTEIRLENGSQYFQTGDETKEQFINRVKKVVEDEHLELIEDLKEVTAKSFIKFNVEQLTQASANAKDTHKEVIEEALVSLKQGMKDFKDGKTVAQGKGFSKAGTVAESAKVTATSKAEKVVKEKAPKAEKVVKEKAPKAEKVVKEKAPKLTLDEAEALKESSKELVGKWVEFMPFGTAIKIKALVKQVVLDKRANMVLIGMVDFDGKKYHKTPNTLTITEAPAEYEAKVIAEAEAKANANAEKIAEAEAKQAAKKETAEKLAAAKAAKVEAKKEADAKKAAAPGAATAKAVKK